MKHVVILGGGFAGVRAGLELIKHNDKDIKVTLIDRNYFHLFTPSLYEVATSEEPQRNIAIPYKEIFDKKIHLLQNSIQDIDITNQVITLNDNESVQYDYLIISLGSESAYFHIEGLKEYSLPLKTLEHASIIKNKIKSLCCKEGACQRKVQLIIGGGGFSGTELAAELLTYKDRLAKQHHLDKNCLEISIIQGSDKLLKELDTHVSDIAQKRIAGPQVKFCFGGHISKVTDKEVITDNGKTFPYHIFIWTGGVSANHLAKDSHLPVTDHGQIIVDEYLRVQGTNNVFAAGDIAGYLDPKTKQPAPGVAQVAEDQGKIAGRNISITILGKTLEPYVTHHWGYVVPLRGRYAAAELMGWMHIDGFFGWVLEQLIFFYYLLHILPPWKAIQKWNTFELEMAK